MVVDDLLREIGIAVNVAKEKHKIFAADHDHAMLVCLSEFREFEAQAMLASRDAKGTRLAKARQEAMDCIVVLARYLEMTATP